VPSQTRPIPNTIAAIDLGSNSFHMLVARTSGGEPVVVDRLREMIQLASGLDPDGRLAIDARQRALECLRRFGQRVRHMPAAAVRAVGTNTLRAAVDSEDFLIEAEQALGHSIATISGIEEARLIFLGVTQTMPDPDVRRLVVDIGGGSTELIAGEALTPEKMESLYMGCVSFSRTHFPQGRLTQENWDRAELAALQELEPISERFRAFGWQEVVGASGTIRAIATLVRIHGWSQDGITPAAIKRLRHALLKAGRINRLKLDGLTPERVSSIAGGAAILSALFQGLSIKTMRCSDGALREGLIYDLLGRIRQHDVRARSVHALADRSNVDGSQAERVERTTLHLLSQVNDSWGLDFEDAQNFLSWASRLHEIGLDIAHSHYHRHGEYIVAHADMLGFSLPEQQLLATLVRAHRRKFPSAIIRRLPPHWLKPAERMATLIRLAVVLHRSRSPLALPALGLRTERKRITLQFPPLWLDEHPLTRADLRTEAAYLSAAGYRLQVT